ncbi:tRNA (guanine(6)-N2)-methyltransferase [Methanocaldococcus fervens]|uniref:RNA methylase n=1 Tax=Methanocaldococcus fervens (strain DSM 4213 / JCM 15782 / AG86) TaxID=573064 RepID=C7P8B8_METFA|nr:tRNA (guanine(6)-N2)-methyltransferase [Methanocaldococcus fervens]ACV24800.1 putative RNA methylase [Methanocaldococcus fervens AG86]
MDYYVTLSPGLENISKNEIEFFGGKIKEIRENKGRIFFSGDLELIPKINYLSRTIERMNILLHKEEIPNISLEDIYERVYSIDWTEWINENQSFAIRPLRAGEHNFTSIDIGRVAGEAVIKSYQKDKNVRLKVNLDEPDVIVRVEVIFDELIVGIDTTGDVALDKRGYRVFNHPAHINATIASSLIYLSDWKDDELFLDPMCGSGTIPIEGALIKRNVPPGKFREKKCGFKFVDIFGYELLNKIKEDIVENKNKYNIIGLDRNQKYLDGAEENAKNAEVLDTIKFIHGDATKLHEVFDSVDVIVVNPPYGIRMGSKRAVKKLYNEFLSSAKKIMHGSSRLIAITAEDKMFKEAIIKNNLEIKDEFNVMFGGLMTKVFYLTL